MLIGGTSEKGGGRVSIFRFEKLASIILPRTPVDRKLSNFFSSYSSTWNISNFSFEKL